MRPGPPAAPDNPVSSRCARIEAVAADWLARRETGLSVDDQAEFSRWLLADPRHASTVQEIESTWRYLQKPRFTGQTGAIVQAIEARARQRARRFRRRVLTSVLGGTMAAAAALAVALLPTKPAPARPDTEVPSVEVRPERRTLADGSVVELNASAEIEVDFSAERRGVRLVRGEAHFAVRKDAIRPFIVTAGAVAVRAVGTEFAVKLASGEVGVLVTEGRVAVERLPPAPAPATASAGQPPIGASPSVVAYVDAGSRLAVPAASAASAPLQPSPLTAAEAQAALAWRGTRIELSNTPLAAVVERFNRQNRLQLALDAADLAEIRISGVFWVDDPEGFSRLIEASAGLRADRSTAGRIVLRR